MHNLISIFIDVVIIWKLLYTLCKNSFCSKGKHFVLEVGFSKPHHFHYVLVFQLYFSDTENCFKSIATKSVTQMFQQIALDTIWDISSFSINPHNVFLNKCYSSVKILFFTPNRVAYSINYLVDRCRECLFCLYIVTITKLVFWFSCSTLSVLDYA